jgi:hypothetical protein
MKKVDVHRAWAPPNASWTPWVKPVLFAHLDEDQKPEPLPHPPPRIETDLIAPLTESQSASAGDPHPYRRSQRVRDVALVIDLPGAESTLLGAWLAGHGFRPVPLYNAVPDPLGVVELSSLSKKLIDAAHTLADLPDDAPPAFMLDAKRMGPGARLTPGKFDNRSICFASDFPSPNALWDAGIRRAVLIRNDLDCPAADLAPILFTWKERNIEILLLRADVAGPVTPLRVTRPSLWDRTNHWFDSKFLRRRASGAFGGVIPEPAGG